MSRVYRSRSRRRRRRKKKWPIVVVSLALLAGLAVALSVYFGFNPFLDRQLRAQFGDAFFSDFDDLSPLENGDDLDSIIANYEPSFRALEEKARDRMDDLFLTALDEYRRSERDGTLDRFVLTNKYIQAGRMLEKNVDTTFYSLLDLMKSELNSKGFSTAITAEIEETYLLAKEEKKRELLNRLREKIGR